MVNYLLLWLIKVICTVENIELITVPAARLEQRGHVQCITESSYCNESKLCTEMYHIINSVQCLL